MANGENVFFAKCCCSLLRYFLLSFAYVREILRLPLYKWRTRYTLVQFVASCPVAENTCKLPLSHDDVTVTVIMPLTLRLRQWSEIAGRRVPSRSAEWLGVTRSWWVTAAAGPGRTNNNVWLADDARHGLAYCTTGPVQINVNKRYEWYKQYVPVMYRYVRRVES